MATLEALILAYVPGTNVSKAHLLEENSRHVTCCSFTSFLVSVTAQITVILDQNRGVLHKECLFLSENIKVQHENARVLTHEHTQTSTDERYRATFNTYVH